jgi:hypothetical protein
MQMLEKPRVSDCSPCFHVMRELGDRDGAQSVEARVERASRVARLS